MSGNNARPPFAPYSNGFELEEIGSEAFFALLSRFRLQLRIAEDVGDAIERAETGQEPDGKLLALDDPSIASAFRKALADVRAERRRREHNQKTVDLHAAGLLAISRLYFDPYETTDQWPSSS